MVVKLDHEWSAHSIPAKCSDTMLGLGWRGIWVRGFPNLYRSQCLNKQKWAAWEKQAWIFSLEHDQVPETGCGVMEAVVISTPLLKWDELHVPHGTFVLCSGKSTPLKTPYFYARSSKGMIQYILPHPWIWSQCFWDLVMQLFSPTFN